MSTPVLSEQIIAGTTALLPWTFAADAVLLFTAKLCFGCYFFNLAREQKANSLGASQQIGAVNFYLGVKALWIST